MLFGFFLRAYSRYGREPKTEEVGRYYREPAEEIPPGLVPYVLTQADPGQSMLGRMISATLLDFARRGSVELIQQQNQSLFGLFKGSETHFKLVAPPANVRSWKWKFGTCYNQPQARMACSGPMN